MSTMVSDRTQKDLTLNILYELMFYSEWNQDDELVRPPSSNGRENTSASYRLWPRWNYRKKAESLIDEITKFQASLVDWHFAIGEVESVIAVLQDNLLEIRTPRDDFSSVVGKAAVVKDSQPQWRRICWSPDCVLLAVASSQGVVNFYDLLGSNLFSIPPNGTNAGSEPWDPERSLAGMFFISSRVKNPKWPFELILVDYGGNLRSFYVSPTEGVLEFHSFSLDHNGVSSVNWDSSHNLIIVSSSPDSHYLSLKDEPLGWGLSSWRLLNDYPYYRLTTPSPEDLVRADTKWGLASWFSSFYNPPNFSVVLKTAISPDAQHLSCLHSCGSISIWQLPSIRLQGFWVLPEQPDYDVQPENSTEVQLCAEDFFPVDISWWAEEKVMIARKNGAVSVCELKNLCNMLGETPEFLHGEPKLAPISTQKGVLVLECEINPDLDSNGDNELNQSMLRTGSSVIKTVLYWITDMERFRPKRIKQKMQQRTFRLLGIKSTTPDELFSRKIEAGEFEEALQLAELYSLDTDRVYQSQWRNSSVSEQSINAYLSKISKRRWVFDECVERIPDTLAAARKLLEFGLQVTSYKKCLELANDEKFTSLEDSEARESLVNETDLLKIPVSDLSEDQKSLIRTRRTLLRFSDRLLTYEKIINSSEHLFNQEAYNKFRRQPAVLSALELGRKADSRAVGLIFTYQGRETLLYRLNILSNFPETISPSNYKLLLPECSGDGEVISWEESKIREKDWCESSHFDTVVINEDVAVYELPQKDEPLTPELLYQWYRNRVYELEVLSNIVDYPLELVKLARERNIKGLDGLTDELITLDVLVYDVGMEDLSLRDLEVMTPLQKAQALMDQSTEDIFVEHIRHRLVPYLQRYEKRQPGTRKQLLSQYLTEVSVADLKCPLKVFQFCTAERWNPIVETREELFSLGLAVVYAYKGVDQLDIAEEILTTLMATAASVPKEMSEQVETALNELSVALSLTHRGYSLGLLYMHEHRDNLDTAKGLFNDLATATANRKPPAGGADWNQLLLDLLTMQCLVFNCVPLELCHEVFVSGVLGSSSTIVIRTAVRSLCCHSEESGHKPLSLQRSVQLVLQAAVHYFDSAESLTDGNISLAKACLNLITEDNTYIQEEKDLIAALQLLSEFKIRLLPMQVRLCTDRMRLIESCLASRSTAYKDYHKLLSLAHKLRICGSDSRQREATILMRTADISFEVGDLYHCAEICQLMMERRHGVGWQVAQRLGQSGEFTDLTMKKKLIAFALIHCPDNKIYDLLDTRSELEYQRLQQYIKEQTSSEERDEGDEEFVDAIATPQTPTKEFLPQLSNTILNTSKVITQLTNSGFWKERFLYKESKKEVRHQEDSSMVEQGFPEFYWTLHGRCHQSVLSTKYEPGEGVEWRQYKLIQAMLQVSLMEQEKLPQELCHHFDNVMVQFASLLLPEDSCVGLAALLAFSHPSISDQCFSTLPLTMLTLQLAVYYSALSVALKLHQAPFHWTPDQVLAWVLRQPGDSAGVQILTKSLTQLRNFKQSQQVEQLDAGVDVRRFAWDPQYKVDSILGLAMCEEWGKLQAALDLGASHGVEGWEIVVSHIRILLLNNSPVLTQRLSDNHLTQLLKDQASSVVARLQEVVLPSLSGVSYNQLISYYSVLNTVAADTQVNGLLPRDHIKLIKKVKATSPDIDYVRLVTRPNELMDTLRPSLSKETIGIVAKLLKELLKALPNLLNSVSVSSLYREWALMQFKAECLNPAGSPLEQFEGLTPYFQKMVASDVLTFVKKTLFCHQTIVKMDSELRTAMLDSLLKVCYQLPNSNDNPDFLKIHELKCYLQEVWALDGVCVSCKNFRNYLVRLDVGCSDPDAIDMVMQTALLDASVPTHVLHKMSELGPHRSLASYITTSLQSLPPNTMQVTTILERVENCLAQGVKQDSWSILVGPITECKQLPASVRKQAAQISQRLGANYTEELEALRLKAEVVLRTPLELSQISDHNSRYLLYKQALSEADNCWDKLQPLTLLLASWPDVDSSWYLELIEAMAEVPNNDVYPSLKKIFKKIPFSQEEIEHLLSRIEDCGDIFKIALCIFSNFKHLHLQAVEILTNISIDIVLPVEVAKRIEELTLATDPHIANLMTKALGQEI